MTSDPRAGAEDALQPMDTARLAWIRQEKETRVHGGGWDIGLAKRAFAAGYAAALANAKTPAESVLFERARQLIFDLSGEDYTCLPMRLATRIDILAGELERMQRA